MNISDSARLFAVANVAACDAFVATWDAKFHYGFWRPVTAIHLANTDGNPGTVRDTTWTSLIASPPVPGLHQRAQHRGRRAFAGRRAGDGHQPDRPVHHVGGCGRDEALPLRRWDQP